MVEQVDDVATDDPGRGEAPPGPGPWARTAAFGFLLVLGAVATSVVTSLIDQFNAYAMLISGIVGAIALLGAWLAASGRKVRLVIAVVLAALALVGNLGGLWGLALPASFWDFAPVVVFLVGAVTALVAGIAALRRLGADPDDTAAGERRLRQVVAGGVGLVLLASAVLSLASGTTVPEAERAGAIAVSANDYAFTPEVVDATPGQRILVTNDDIFYHTFTIEELGIDVALLPGDQALVDVPAEATGTYEFFCVPHLFGEGEGMVGTLRTGA